MSPGSAVRADNAQSQIYSKAPTLETMIVPRAFRYRNEKETVPNTQDEKVMMSKPKTPHRSAADKGRVDRPSKMMRIGSVPAATPSVPVLIPTRSQSVNKRLDEVVRKSAEEKQQNNKGINEQYGKKSPTTEVLGATSISPFSTYPHSRMPNSFRKRSSGLQVIEGIDPEAPRNTLSSLSPRSWDLLQTLPENCEIATPNFRNDPVPASLASGRSSTSSLPSLDYDRSSSRFSSSPSTPGNTPRKSYRREKSFSSSFTEDCGDDHPLFPATNRECEVQSGRGPYPSDAEALVPDVVMPTIRSRLSFKSNLTASLRQIKSAARSFSNFNISSNQHNNAYNPSVLLDPPHLTDDRRPVIFEEIPGPALRRYLNPLIASRRHSIDESCKGSVQMQTYQKIITSSTNATSPPIFTPSARVQIECDLLTPEIGTPRQREPRVNSDFLRVIVLEMNMRKAGKLKLEAPGRARIYLPPREATKSQTLSSDTVPRRWSGIVT